MAGTPQPSDYTCECGTTILKAETVGGTAHWCPKCSPEVGKSLDQLGELAAQLRPPKAKPEEVN